MTPITNSRKEFLSREDEPLFTDLFLNHIIEYLFSNGNAIAEDLSMLPIPRICYYTIKHSFLAGCVYFMVKCLYVYKSTNELLEDLHQRSLKDFTLKSKRKRQHSNKFGDYAIFLRTEKLKLLKIARQNLLEMKRHITSFERVFDQWTFVFLIVTTTFGISMMTDNAPLPKDLLIFTVITNIALMVTRIYVNERIRGEKAVVYAKLLKLMKTCCHEKFTKNLKKLLTSHQQKQHPEKTTGFGIDFFLLAAVLDTACMLFLIGVN